MNNLDKVINLLKEEFKAGTIRNNIYYEIFVNPTREELKDLTKDSKYKMVRFIIDTSKKKLYVFDAHLLHHYAAREINIPLKYEERYIPGMGKYHNGKIIFHKKFHSAEEEQAIKEIKEKNPKWYRKYFTEL